MIENHKVVSNDEWLAARKQLLIKEKEYLRLGDELARQRRELPWERVAKEYVFDGPAGKETLTQLFAGRSQLAVYHFMFGPDWEACSARMMRRPPASCRSEAANARDRLQAPISRVQNAALRPACASLNCDGLNPSTATRPNPA